MVMTILVVGLVLGGTFALMALGSTIQYGAARFVNLIFGQLIIGGSFLIYLAITATGLEPFVTFAFMVPLGYAACYLAYPVVTRPAAKCPGKSIHLENDAILLAVGLMFFLQSIYIIGRGCGANWLVGIALALFVGGLLCVAAREMRRGTVLRAAISRAGLAPLLGIDNLKQGRLIFAAGGALAAVGGIVWSMYPPFTPMAGTLLVMKVLVIALMGYMGNLVCAIAAALILALVETGVSAAFDPSLTLTATYTNFLSVLLWPPSGLPS